MPGHEIWKKGKTSPRYLPDPRGIPYNHVHTCTCIYLIIIIASVRTADTNLRLAIPMIHLRRTNVISRDRHVIIIPDLTLPQPERSDPSASSLLLVAYRYGRSSPSKGFPPPLPPALLFQTISADLGGI